MAHKNDYIDIVDKHVGNKIHSLRLARGLSRQQLSKIIEVTHQQVQKYEKGSNRLSIGRLILIAKALGEVTSYFYQEIDKESDKALVTQHQRMCLEVSRNFMKIKDPEHQIAVNVLIRSLSRVF